MDNWNMMNQYGMGQMDPAQMGGGPQNFSNQLGSQMNNLGGYGGGGQMQNFGNMMGSGQADPYQMNAWKNQSPMFSAQQGGGPNPNAQDMAKKMQWQRQGQMDPAQQQRPMFSASNQQGPYQMPGGPSQISTVGPNNGLGYTGLPGQVNPNTNMTTTQTGPGGMRNTNMIGPRPQQPPTGPRGNMPNLNPNQLAALQPGSMGRPPGMGIGPGGPTRNVPGFQPNAWRGFGRGNIQNPYQPQGQNRGW
jgi:hypothetical protein